MAENINIPVQSCIITPTEMQVDMNFYYTQALPWINNYLTEAQKKEMFGKDPTCDYNKINNFWYLLMYIQVISDQRQIDLNNELAQPCSYYADNLTCLIDYFKCLNIDIIPLLCIFGLYCNCTETGAYGVGQDEIEVSLTVYP